MSTDLIDRLAAGLRPAPRLAVVRRLAFGIGAGAALSAVLTAAILGLRPDMARAAAGAMFWVKLAYTVALAGLAAWLHSRASTKRGLAIWGAVTAVSSVAALVMGVFLAG